MLFLAGFFICLNYYILRVLKDALIVTTSGGAAIIPYLKVWAVFPSVLVASLLLSYLFRRLSRPRVTHLLLGSFSLFFALYLVVDLTRPALISFYVGCELWKVLILFALFWGFVNLTTPLERAKEIYGPLMVSGSLGAIAAGFISDWACRSDAMVPLLLSLVIASTLILFFLFQRLYRTRPVLAQEAHQPQSMRATLKLVLSSRVLICIATLIVSEYVAFNIVEVIWKQQIFELFPDRDQFGSYMSKTVIFTGLMGILASLFVSGPTIKRFGWTATALLPPTIILIANAGFFTSLLMGSTALPLLIGALHNGLCRAARQAFADPTKEMAYIPLPKPHQTHGKALIDGTSSTIGKLGGSLLLQGPLFHSIPSCALVVLCATLTTFGAVLGMGKTYRQSLAH